MSLRKTVTATQPPSSDTDESGTRIEASRPLERGEHGASPRCPCPSAAGNRPPLSFRTRMPTQSISQLFFGCIRFEPAIGIEERSDDIEVRSWELCDCQ